MGTEEDEVTTVRSPKRIQNSSFNELRLTAVVEIGEYFS
jgi:hypothetical protein